MSAARLSDEDVERIAEAVARKLRDAKPHNEQPPIVVTERHLRIAADKLSKPRKIRGR